MVDGVIEEPNFKKFGQLVVADSIDWLDGKGGPARRHFGQVELVALRAVV